jgi:hypothetical protein
MRATQRCDVARQVSKALRVQLQTSIDHIELGASGAAA